VGNLDFFFKHDMARGSFRPVRCSLAGQKRTVLFTYGFDTTRTQTAWVGEWGSLSDQRGAMLVEDGTWAVEVLRPRHRTRSPVHLSQICLEGGFCSLEVGVWSPVGASMLHESGGVLSSWFVRVFCRS
jgi:hypothetical protein